MGARRTYWISLQNSDWRGSSKSRRRCDEWYNDFRNRHYKQPTFVPTLFIERSTMAPGTSSMLRARRRDVNIKPNRILDRNSSRGMIYENEELRLRTININAEVERGQMDIKKLRRENEQLRREIWNLRDEYERLESILKSQQEPSTEEEDEDEEESEEEEGENKEKDDTDHDNATNQEKASQDCDGLSVVEEEPEDISSDVSDERPRVVTFSTDNKVILLDESNQQGVVTVSSSQEVNPQPSIEIPSQVRAGICDFVSTGIWPDSSFIPSPQLQIPGVPVFAGFQNSELEQLLRNVASEQSNRTVLTPRGSEVVTTAILQRRQSYTRNGDRKYDTITCAASSTTTSGGFNCATSFPLTEGPTIEEESQCEKYNGPAPPFLRLNSVQPFTVVFPVLCQQLANLSVQEVIDTLSEQLAPQLMSSLRGVRLVGGNCFLSFSCQQDAETILASPLLMRGVPLLLEDASTGTAVLALNGVPHDVADEAVATVLSNFGTLVGTVERRLYKGVDTGERLARLRARLAVPRSLWLGGCRVSLRVLQDEEVAALSIARRKSFRSHLNVRLNPNGTDTPPAIPPLPSSSYNQKPGSATACNQERVPNNRVCPTHLDLSTSGQNQKTTPTAPANTPVNPEPIEINTAGTGDSQSILPTTPTPSSTNDMPFTFPAPLISNSFLDPSGLRRVNSVMNTSSMPSTLDISHIRSQSTPPCVNDLPPRSAGSEPDLQAQFSNPASPSIIKRPLQRHRPSRKAPKVNADAKKVNGECSASSSSGPDSPSKPNRRRASVYFGKRDKSYGSTLNRTISTEPNDGTFGDVMTTCSERERSNSDVSSRISVCRRKLSTTGRESGKVPWCGCWGNGCI